jgi:hypothetical protein
MIKLHHVLIFFFGEWNSKSTFKHHLFRGDIKHPYWTLCNALPNLFLEHYVLIFFFAQFVFPSQKNEKFIIIILIMFCCHLDLNQGL